MESQVWPAAEPWRRLYNTGGSIIADGACFQDIGQTRRKPGIDLRGRFLSRTERTNGAPELCWGLRAVFCVATMWAAKPGTPPPAPVLELPPSTIHFTDSCTVYGKYWFRVERAKYREGLRVCKQHSIPHKPRAKMVVFRHVKICLGLVAIGPWPGRTLLVKKQYTRSRRSGEAGMIAKFVSTRSRLDTKKPAILCKPGPPLIGPSVFGS
ncbi:hypothetical protein CCHR01_03219 [Colletotrichum chrysophilum]|uniref:Uncharacterized protein n=1 Tax=Colletotrichum chrysophilum TaxID=1836956 RepID=A0AAD9ATA5_9PEZI|nr:hypothetical protein CCHR01_03219 [Colletotrichum chrysophilum]